MSLRTALKRIVRPPAPSSDGSPVRRIEGPGPVHLAVAALLVGLSVASCAPGDSRSEFASVDVDVGTPPETRVDDVVDVLHGVEVADPYRWLEDQESPDTRAWIDAQNEYADAVFAQLPGRERLTALASSLLEIEVQGTPTVRGDRYFFTKRSADDDLSIVYYREGLTGEDRVLLDPHDMSEDHTTSVNRGDVSKDGSLMVYFVREGGVDETEMRVLDVEAGSDLPDVFPPNRYGSAQLSPDKSGLFYGIYGTREPRIYYHRMGTDPSQDLEIFGEGYTTQDIPVGQLSDDGEHMLITFIEGSSGPTSMFLADVRDDGTLGDRTVMIDDGETRTFGSFAGDRILLTTDLDAPNSRVMVADIDDPGVDAWEELIPESDDRVIQGAGGVGGHYFVSYLEDVQPRVAQYDTDGELVREIEFETLGSTFMAGGEWDSDEAFFGFSSFHVPSTTYRFDVESGDREVWFQTEVPLDTNSMTVEQVWYESRDGTRVPMFVVHRKDINLDGTNPTYLTGYGGFNLSRTPGFSAQAAAWVELGGVYAVPNLRGGGEFGEEWHRAGMFGNKQNVFDDFIAAAEHLIDQGYTSPEHLAIAGGSNGGLLVGAAMTQRPDLFGAVLCTYPLLDMVRYHQFMVARFWIPEYGSADDPDQFEYLYAYSPYHNVEPGTEYPATLFITGDGDTRVAPLHGRKMAALVQAANGGDEPILLRYHTKAGHSGGQPVSQQIEQMVDTMSFLLWQVGGG
ncbi:MAG: prolyl oligopeptidase family serine peptidase [Gemmatimonadota bacterium]|nr:prolyl oligopeptidase family serine peptidase [Gemmatimonadota bacterium]